MFFCSNEKHAIIEHVVLNNSMRIRSILNIIDFNENFKSVV